MVIKPIKKRRKRRKNYYFTQEHEDAIVEYARISCNRRRTVLYTTLIQPALGEMVDKIIYTYKNFLKNWPFELMIYLDLSLLY